MRFSTTIVLSFAASAFGQTNDFDIIYNPKSGEEIPAGSSHIVTWDAPAKYVEDTIKIELLGGPTQLTQTKVAEIATGIKNNAKTYNWKVDASLGDKAVYGLKFILESNPDVFQYSNPFHIKTPDSSPPGVSAIALTRPHNLKSATASITSTLFTNHTGAKHNKTVACNTVLGINTSLGQPNQVVITATSITNPTATAHGIVITPIGAADTIRVSTLTILGAVVAAFAL